MSVTSLDKDFDNLTLTLVADFDAPDDRVWELWADPRQLERWWGPPGYPATFEEHDLSPGGSVTYFMTGPDGERHHGWWRITSVDPASSLAFTDGFADERRGAGDRDADDRRCRSSLTSRAGGTRMELRVDVRVARADGAARSRWGWPRACARRSGRWTPCSRADV